MQALRIGKDVADDQVERSLFERATGYSHDAVKILQHQGVPIVFPHVEPYPPETVAAILWLKNRRPMTWRDRVDVEHYGEVSIADALKCAASAPGREMRPADLDVVLDDLASFKFDPLGFVLWLSAQTVVPAPPSHHPRSAFACRAMCSPMKLATK